MNDRFIVVDVETTGHSVAKGDRIIQIGAVVIENGEIIERFASFVNPEVEIPPFIEELTGINQAMVEHAPTFKELAVELLPLFENVGFVAHNVPFDLSFLKNQFELIGEKFPKMKCYDTVELSRMLLPKEESYKLGHLAFSLGLSHDRPHQADSDAEVTAEIFLYLLNKLKGLPLLTLEQLIPIVRYFRSSLEPMISAFIQEKVMFGVNDAQEFDCYRQLALKKQPEHDNEPAPESFKGTFSEFRSELFSADKGLKEAFTKYETREGQVRMMDKVDHAFHHNEHVLIEAGTGTGKSLAYLLPAVLYAHETDQAVVISTQTIPLQDQLLMRDLPLLERLLPFPVDVALLKGRSHYLCLRKFEQSLRTISDDTYDVRLMKAQILVWLTETDYGDVEELNLSSGGRGFWFEVQSDAKSDLGKFSPWFSRCFYHRARRRAREAHLVITNHALLLTDLVHDQALLPSYSHAVIDEAHHLVEAASEHLGMKADYVTFSYLLQRIGLDHDHGIQPHLSRILEEYGISSKQLHDELIISLTAIKDEIDELFRMLNDYVTYKRKTGASDIGRISYRYRSFDESGSSWNAILECTMRVHMFAKDIRIRFDTLIKQFLDIKDQISYVDHGLVTDSERLVDALMEEEQYLYELLLEADPEFVYWIEIEPRGARNATFIYSKPIQVADRLADQFFAKKKSVVLTSATLSINGSFDYQLEQLGLEDFGAKVYTIESPFSYKDQARLLIPKDMPAIKEVGEKQFAMDAAIKVWRIAERKRGKMLVLFTSYEMLKMVYDYIKDLSEYEPMPLIGQGITSGSRAKLIKSFKQAEEAILFGTSSFWEGIDLPGDELTSLVIVRLPFSPPDQPLLQAQLERAKEAGKSPFMDVSLPQAIIRFKQGFGRLIRTKEDKGCVFVLDRRISTTRYGSQFIKSLPDVPVDEHKLEVLLDRYEDFL
ncbi:ATP-dependent DNA helicase DinG [Alkalihalophilus marmarensis]|uniref:ATP-dependent DNA helicase DinG n=1 Tax=Alkalihalophilus marmarensis TaxID=521377 RepID=UPI002E241A69|nr:ATP-dependent DNA helicase DinG [Alkalihalophilus marmarensis]MED1601542.1 ATP-dependent DNA helicase DinG [Alkalihalophilus marmarensis]